jgi:hypothetical protein
MSWRSLRRSAGQNDNTALMTIPHGPACDPPPHCVRARQPPETGDHLAIGLGPDHEKPVVGQDAAGQYADRMTLMRLDNDPLERHEAGVFSKETHLADRAVQKMIELRAWCFFELLWARDKRVPRLGARREF